MASESLLFFKNINPFVMKAKYLQDIPNINKPFTLRFIPHPDGIELQETGSGNTKIFLNRKDITKISVEDQSTLESRVGFKRLLLVGIFAFAWKKRTTVPLSFLVIDYTDEFGETQEVYIQSETKSGFQDFTNVKYNLQKFWKEADENPNVEAVIKETESAHKEAKAEEESKAMTGCLVIIGIIFIIYIIQLLI